MTHGKCGAENPNAPCMADGKCSKHYPRNFCESTTINRDGYPDYGRPNDGRKHGRDELDNSHVVPYCAILLLIFECHINVELTFNIKSMKYMHKYVYKGHDRTTMEFGRVPDEIQQYLDARYISAHEAFWRIMKNELHTQVPAVMALPVHLPDQQTVIFDGMQGREEALVRAEKSKTPLMAYFEANTQNLIGYGDKHAHDVLYVDFPEFFTYIKKEHYWKPREKNFSIGRLHFANPVCGERFYLRTLLTVVTGATSFENIRTYEGVIYNTFKEACLARGLLEDDQEWRLCLQEASTMQSGHSLRRLFATILAMSFPSRPGDLWNMFKVNICDDVAYLLENKYGILNPSEDRIYDYGLYDIHKILLISGKALSKYPDMPQYTENWEQLLGNHLILEQMAYNAEEEKACADRNISLFNPEQKAAHDIILNAVINQEEGKMFFLNGPGGTGKSFVWNTLAHSCRAKKLIVLCVASSGIASIILKGGRTSHSTFSIPIDIDEGSVCHIKKQSETAELMKKVRLIIWDEVPMQHRHACEAVDRTLRDILDKDVPFGGIPVAWGGDFQQTLPVVPRGSKEEIINACIQNSSLWHHIQILFLKKNMRIEANDPNSEYFAKWLLDIGHGKDLPLDHTFKVPAHMICGPDASNLISEIYPNIQIGSQLTDDFFLHRGILCPRNLEVNAINTEVYQQFGGQGRIYNSVDSIRDKDQEEAGLYPVEYLNTLNFGGVPPSKLEVKPGVPLMLLRNIDPGIGLCNGTRLRLVRMTNRCLEVRILTGPFAQKLALIPRITVSSSNQLPFELYRLQFPVRLAFAMTINKSQGQSLGTVGLGLRTPAFGHGQVYVGLSRGTNWNRIKVLLKETELTSNIVYKDVLLD
jgi:hypothetical protein